MEKERVQNSTSATQQNNTLVNLYSYNNQPIPMQAIHLLTDRSDKPTHSIREVPKEEFFNTKKHQKRMKTSLCFSEPIEMHQMEHAELDSSLLSMPNQRTQASFNKDLDSTISEEAALAFKLKQPKRKMNYNLTNQCNGKETPQSPVNNLHLSPRPSVGCQSKEKRGTSNSLTRSPLRVHLNKKVKDELKISDFRLLQKLGVGSYCEVFKCVDRRSGFVCALKIMNKERMKELQVQQNIRRQLKISLFCDHTNINKLYSFFWDKQNIYLVSELATDKNLFEYLYQPKLKLKKGLLSEEAANFTKQICNAISYLHRHSILHRDLKPQNILITMFNTIKICDLGWSVYNPTKQLRSTFCGTPLYLAPELICHTEYDESVDIWAIGVITYEMMTEEIPFKIEKAHDLRKILFEEVHFDRIRNKVAADFIERAMRKDASKRVMIGELLSHPFVN